MNKKNFIKYLLIIFTLTIFLTSCNTFNSAKQNNDKVNYKNAILRETGRWPLVYTEQLGNLGEPIAKYVYDSLYQYIKITDKIYPRMANGLPKISNNTTTIKLKKNIKWSDGVDFTSKDVWAGIIMHSKISQYLTNVDTPDDYTVVLYWADPSPSDKIKDILIANYIDVTIPYHALKDYVDNEYEIIKTGETTNDLSKRGPFGINIADDQKLRDALQSNWDDCVTHSPDKAIVNGPYNIQSADQVTLTLVKRKDYYNANNVKFNKIILTQTVDPQKPFDLLKSGNIDRVIGMPQKSVADKIMNNNKDLLHYTMPDINNIGLLYNIQRYPFNNVNFRRALSYVFDRNKIRQVSNIYALSINDYSITGVSYSMLDQIIKPENKKKFTTFNYDLTKAQQILNSIGWLKGSDGIYKDSKGQVYDFDIGTNEDVIEGVNCAKEIIKELNAFGFPAQLDGKYYDNLKYKVGAYDISVDTTSSTESNVIWFSLDSFYHGFPAYAINFPMNILYNSGLVEFAYNSSDITQSMSNVPVTNPKVNKAIRNSLKASYIGIDGKPVNIEQTLDQMSVMDDAQMQKTAENLIWINNENAFGLDCFQNVTGTWFNMKTTKMKDNWPMSNIISKYNRNMPIPTGDADLEKVIETNTNLSGNQLLVNGEWMPN